MLIIAILVTGIILSILNIKSIYSSPHFAEVSPINLPLAVLGLFVCILILLAYFIYLIDTYLL